MKKITTIAATFLLFAGVTMNAQTALKKGSVTYKMEMTGNDEASAMMGESTMAVHFDEKMQATDMNMMGGMMLMKTITPVGNLKDSKMTIEVMGMKYEIIEIGEEALKESKGIGNLENALEVSYDKKDTKEIAGFKCYKAIVKMNDGTTNDFYITEGIAVQDSKDAKVKLAGYPLQMKTTTQQGEMTMTATSFSKDLPKDCFSVGEGFTKVTMEEFQKQMGGM
ncbi:hypothetical protein [Flavobacterium psychraquaticum]|uniref:hypothetical protein n=1 Tax=Flavobacterium psychraquaticum TaxID=3103958 RepID=UPI002ACEC496|nr:hypothetical protein [Flavobacterium sp. LB-N7T]